MAHKGQSHPENVPGPFYVLNGCCTACDIPVSEAPDLFTYDKANHCFVKRQPGTKNELERTLRAAWTAEFECIRYRGSDSEILRRFAESGLPHLCDVPPPLGISPVVRDLVTFGPDSPDQTRMSAVDLAQSYRDYLLGLNRQREREGLDARYGYRITPVAGDSVVASMDYSWFEDHFHTVVFRNAIAPESRWLIRHFSADRAGGRGVSQQIDSWLQGAGTFSHIRWYSAEEWAGGAPGQESPQ